MFERPSRTLIERGKDMKKTALRKPKIVTRDQWSKQRGKLLKKEKRLTRQRDALTAELRKLPWVKMDPSYVFETRKDKRSLAQLFEGKSQLLVYHFMLGPGWGEGCPSCSFWADHFASFRYHLPQRDVAFKVISRAPLKEIEKYRKRMGWEFDWVSSSGTRFNLDLGVSSGTDDEEPGISIFARVGQDVYHTYFTTGRGLEVINSTYAILDLVPKGRDEAKLPWPMAWVKRHDKYSR
jgi:predicted dithiol-disulfide oxidoreductase (DUF899 family)